MILALALALTAIGYAVVDIATKAPGREVVRVDGIATAQQLFGGVPQEGERLGSADAPVSIQVFADMQCGSCREDFLGTIPALADRYARPGDAKLLIRHYSVAQNPLELGFFGAEAAAEQGYGWQYTYLFFRNQDEAERFGVGEEFMDSLAGAIGEPQRPRMGGIPRRQRRQRRSDRDQARRLRHARHRSRHPHPAGDDRQRPRRDPDPAGRPPAGQDRTRDRRSRRQGLMRPDRRPHLEFP